MNVLPDDTKLIWSRSRPTPHDFLAFLSYGCCQLEAPFNVKINVQTQDDYHTADEKVKRPRRSIPKTEAQHQQRTSAQSVLSPTYNTEEEESQLTSPEFIEDAVEIVLTAVMDSGGHLVELVFNRCVEIPQILIKVIGLCIPYQKHLCRISVRWGPLTSVALYEISKFLLESHLTEICLDDSPVAGRNYEVLLEQPSHLHYLSLSRCELDDVDCVNLASLLAHPRPAAKTLNILLLVSNMIGDRGARALGHVLRSNRSLQCLNLAGNQITDAGASCIFKSLMEFSLTNDELIGKRSRHFKYLRLRSEVHARCTKELIEGKSQDEVRLTRRRTIMRAHRKYSIGAGPMSSTNSIYQKADAMANELIGFFYDPFSSDQTMLRGGDQLYCIGNTALCCLNLSYNNLEFGSLTLLYKVLTHQSWLGARVTTGLLRVSLEGNNLPIGCDELILIKDLLKRAQASKGKYIKRGSEKIK